VLRFGEQHGARRILAQVARDQEGLVALYRLAACFSISSRKRSSWARISEVNSAAVAYK
jgi:hypothetical protein